MPSRRLPASLIKEMASNHHRRRRAVAHCFFDLPGNMARQKRAHGLETVGQAGKAAGNRSSIVEEFRRFARIVPRQRHQAPARPQRNFEQITQMIKAATQRLARRR